MISFVLVVALYCVNTSSEPLQNNNMRKVCLGHYLDINPDRSHVLSKIIHSMSGVQQYTLFEPSALREYIVDRPPSHALSITN